MWKFEKLEVTDTRFLIDRHAMIHHMCAPINSVYQMTTTLFRQTMAGRDISLPCRREQEDAEMGGRRGLFIWSRDKSDNAAAAAWHREYSIQLGLGYLHLQLAHMVIMSPANSWGTYHFLSWNKSMSILWVSEKNKKPFDAKIPKKIFNFFDKRLPHVGVNNNKIP